MYKFSLLSLAAIAALASEPVAIQKITVEASADNTADEMVKFSRQSDLGEMLSNSLPEITLVRASAVGNDIILRGFKKDNINVTIDDAKVYGACPNRMDPPAMHVSSSQIASVEVQEGPFDVTQFGSLGGKINVVTKDPKKGVHGEISTTLGSYDYRKVGGTLEAGNDTVQALVGYSRETSGQYKDGDGKTMAEQLVGKVSSDDQYKTSEMKRDAYERENFWTKLVFTPTSTDKFTFSYFGDRADNVLYPAFQMDAQVDDTDMFNVKYQRFNLSQWSDELKLEAYHSKVEHEMGTEFRNSSNTPSKYRTHVIDATIKGARIENTATLSDIKTTLGLDTSVRNWNGVCTQEPTGALRQTRIPDVDTKNIGIYMEAAKNIGKTDLSAGLRYDSTSIKPNQKLANVTGYSMQTLDIKNYLAAMPDREYDNISANLMVKHNYTPSTNVFIGIGQSIRVPDARELYFVNDNTTPNDSVLAMAGNTTLKETINREIDLGAEQTVGNLHLKGTAFYSDLKDYIYTYKTATTMTFANIDARIIGFDAKADYALNNEWTLETAMAYQKGIKKDPSQVTATQTDKDLAEIPPLKARVALTFDSSVNYAMAEWIAARFQTIDSDNGEKEIPGYSVFNLKYGHDFQNGFSLMTGINNFFDKTYALSNSYIGRNVLTGTTDAPIMNEMGRNFYATLSYKF
ncbi:MAG: TonB-dependent receptor [Sulfuricurvum sp.]|nr:TonB-dependent receptor [Sulfuricurvum sp.]